MGNLYTLNCIQVDTGVQIHGIQSCTYSPAIQNILRKADGEVNSRQSTIMGATPSIRFSTYNIAQAMTAISVLGLEATSSEFAFQLKTPYGTNTPASSVKLTVAKGMFIPESITCSQGGLAVLNVNFIAVDEAGSGGTHPVTVSTAALTIASYITETFTIGTCTAGGATVPEVDGITVNFGLQPQTRFSDGQPYPTQVVLMNQDPSFEIMTKDLSFLSTSNLTVGDGTGISKVTFRQKTSYGTNMATLGVSFAAATNSSHSLMNDISANQGDLAGYTIRIPLLYNGTNAVITYSAAETF